VATELVPRPELVAYRPAREADIDACTRVWKAGIDDYQGRLNQPPMPDDLAHLGRLLTHLLITDPDRFWVATREVAGSAQVVGFAAASLREDLWFLAMLFVDPAVQGGGVGQALMDRAQAASEVAPGGPAVPGPDDPLDSGIRRWGMCTDALQPISNAMYARRGMVPRTPIWRLAGEVRRWTALPLPARSLEVVSFEELAGDGPDRHRRLAGIVNALDQEILGSTHGVDHAFLRREGRSGLLLRERGGRALGYVYGSGGGRLGPVAAVDPDVHPVLIGASIRETPMPGTVAAWVPGTSGIATRALLDAGLRLDGFPGLVCWSTLDLPFDRYIPFSMAIL
jgi:GNAT superfamily N-acetyltransferase